jgi:catechol 2,3-dioxygenase-like lactoylglutathione lyase family enzyme
VIDHNGLFVSDYRRSIEFYSKLLEPFGYRFMTEIDPAMSIPSPSDPPQRSAEYALEHPLGGFGLPTPGGPAGAGRKPPFWVTQARAGSLSPVVCSFVCPERALVDAFYRAGIAAGAKESSPPSERNAFGGRCYSASILDFDRNEIEAMAWIE